MVELVVASNALGALLFGVLAVVLLFNWKRGWVGSLLLASTAISALWFGVQLAYYREVPWLSLPVVQIGEVIRDAGWFACLVAILNLARAGRPAGGRVSIVPVALGALCAVQILLLLGMAEGIALRDWFGMSTNVVLVGFLLLGVAGLVLVEQLYRNTRVEQRWSVRPFCFGVGGLFAYDIFLYSHAVLFNEIVPDLWNVRGFINAVSVPLMALAVVRNPHWKADLFVSRQVVFHSTAVVLIGGYLLLMSAAGYYIRVYGGTWGNALQAVFFFGTLLLLIMLLSSSQLRARVKVFLAKHFYRNKYEYREEWLNFTRTLAECEGERRAIESNIVRAIANLMDCRWGMLWLRQDGDRFVPVSQWHVGALPHGAAEPAGSRLAGFLENRGWVVDLDEYAADPGLYDSLPLPGWLREMTNAWLLVPLLLRDRLIGFVVLSRSLANRRLDWEDRDLLKTVAQQTASYLALLNVTEDLTQARQFEAYNRLSAFVVHDLKNLAAQLSLVMSNARRYRDNPEFIADAFATVGNAVTKMNRMVENLRAGRSDGAAVGRVNLADLLASVVADLRVAEPVPTLDVGPLDVVVKADRARLAKALSHLVQNAQEATPAAGRVDIRLRPEDGYAIVEIADTGCGMETEFIRDHLFRPFDTTKGNAGMGIGVFETRQIVTANGGTLAVTSAPGEGTRFTIRLPQAPPEVVATEVLTVAESTR